MKLSIMHFDETRSQLLKGTFMLGLIGFAGLWLVQPEWAMLYGKGALLSLLYLHNLAQQVSIAEGKALKPLMAAFAILRLAVTSLVIVWLGNFEFLKTGVVLCGFLSYKIVLIALIIRNMVYQRTVYPR